MGTSRQRGQDRKAVWPAGVHRVARRTETHLVFQGLGQREDEQARPCSVLSLRAAGRLKVSPRGELALFALGKNWKGQRGGKASKETEATSHKGERLDGTKSRGGQMDRGSRLSATGPDRGGGRKSLESKRSRIHIPRWDCPARRPSRPSQRLGTPLLFGLGALLHNLYQHRSASARRVADRLPTLGGPQRSGVLREARALGCRGMDEAREWCWAGLLGLPPSVQLPQNPGSSSPSALLSAPFSLPLFLSLHPSTFCISLAHLSSSIPGLSAPFLFLSTSLSLSDSFPLPLILPFPLRITSSEAETIHLRGITCSWPSRHGLGLARP